MAAENCVCCLLEAMDDLWFHQIILFSDPPSFNFPETHKTSSMHTSESAELLSKNSSQTSVISDQEISPLSSVYSSSQTSSQESDHEKETRPQLVSSKARYHSSSPISAQKQSRSTSKRGYSARRKQKPISCRSLEELQLKEVEGFMDLGFNFKKENLSQPMMRLIPGLQRIDSSEFISHADSAEDEEEKGVMRPYLSESWLVRRPDSPLLNLRIPNRVSATADMKKHLKYWARTVASAIQES